MKAVGEEETGEVVQEDEVEGRGGEMDGSTRSEENEGEGEEKEQKGKEG